MNNYMTLNNLDKMNKFHEKYKLIKAETRGNKYFECLYLLKILTIIKVLLVNKTQGPDGFISTFYQSFKKKTPVLH